MYELLSFVWLQQEIGVLKLFGNLIASCHAPANCTPHNSIDMFLLSFGLCNLDYGSAVLAAQNHLDCGYIVLIFRRIHGFRDSENHTANLDQFKNVTRFRSNGQVIHNTCKDSHHITTCIIGLPRTTW